jgi:uncharacterized protein (DUF58 family)
VTLDVAQAVPSAQRTVRTLELAVTRRLDGLLQGEYRGFLLGPGWEPNDGRAYQVGDDVRRIDWSLSARSDEIHVRDSIADRELETWVVVDGSASLDFGTDQWRKRDLAVAATAAFGFMSCMSGSRFGAVVAGSDGIRVHPAAGGRAHVRRVLHDLHRHRPEQPGGADLNGALERIRRLGRRPGAVVVVSDLICDDTWVRPMRVHAHRSNTVIVEIRDVREDELPAVGLLTLVDPETGRTREVQTNDRALRARFNAAAIDRRAAVRRTARSSGADHLVLTTNRDWLTDIVRYHIIKRRQR